MTDVTCPMNKHSQMCDANTEKDVFTERKGCPLGLSSNGKTPTDEANLTYSTYLCLDSILAACQPLTSEPVVHDEHLFIVTHQAFELWFKQILYELDSIREIFSSTFLNERQSLCIVSRLQRVVAILKVCVSQFDILETMTPLDFLEFRTVLKQGSGFQSFQFRLLENKIGVLTENRIPYAKKDYKEFLQHAKYIKSVENSEKDDSLFDLIERWLERTPGAFDEEYWTLFQRATEQWIFDAFVVPYEMEKDEVKRKELKAELMKQKGVFDRLFKIEVFEELRMKGDFRLSHGAFLGALFIVLWRSEPRFSQPYQILSLLMDIDSLMTKFRYAHVTMVHRMIGAKVGTGGSSGYQYLRSTISDRYKVFTDIFNLSTYVIPRAYLPCLPRLTRRRLSTWNLLMSPVRKGSEADHNNSVAVLGQGRSSSSSESEFEDQIKITVDKFAATIA